MSSIPSQEKRAARTAATQRDSVSPKHPAGYISYPSTCKICDLGRGCRMVRMSFPDQLAEELTSIHPFDLEQGQHLFQENSEASRIFIIRAGSLKSYVSNSNGCQQVLDFYMPGHVLGGESLTTCMYSTSVIALEHVSVCSLPACMFETEGESPAYWNRWLGSTKTAQLRDRQNLLSILQHSPVERVIYFLTVMSRRFKETGCSASEFNLTMSRHDIASYLGLDAETVSRCLTDLQNDDLLTIDRRRVKLLDLDRLHTLQVESMAWKGGCLKGQRPAELVVDPLPGS